jgi:hypothetical protein
MLIFLILIVLSLILIFYLKSNKNLNKTIPYVKDGYYPFIGNLFSLINNRTKYLMKCRQKYGETFKIKLLNQTIIFILNPSDWTNVIRNQSFLFMGDTFSKTIFDMDHNFFGDFTFF